MRASEAVFVPAVMGAGLLFWVIVIAREGYERSVADLRRHRRVRARAEAVADAVVHPTAEVPAGWSGLPRRSAVAWAAAVCLGVAAYLLPGAVANYLRPGGYVSEIVWILALAALTVTVFAVVGATLAVAALRQDGPPPWVRPLLLAMPLLRPDDAATDAATHAVGSHPHHRVGSWPRTAVSLGFLASAVVAATVTLAVAMEDARVLDLDARLLERAREVDPSALLSAADQLGSTVAAVVSSLVFMIVFRHRAPRLAVTYPIAVVLGILTNVLLSPVVSRGRPPAPDVGTALASYPSGHTIQAVLLAIFVTAAVQVWARRWWLTVAAGLVMATAATLTGVGRVVLAAHWPSDVLGSVTIAAMVASVAVLATGVGLDRGGQHRSEPMLVLPERLVAMARPAARISSLVVHAGFVVLAATVGLPAAPEGFARATDWERVGQSVLFVAAGVATLVAWRWEAVGATALAVTATVLAVFASVEYEPAAALLVTGAFFVPSVLFWLSWQRTRPMRSLVALAVVAGVLVSGTWVAATTVHNHFFGPAHPQSQTVLPPSPLLDWVWAGALTPTGFTVTAKVTSDGPTELMVSTQADLTGARAFPTQPAGEDRVVRFDVEGLEPDTQYHYAVARDGAPDVTRQGRVRTAPTGPASFTVTFGSCARTGSSGAVFDEIASFEPLLHLITGDFHYANVERDDPGLLRSALDRTISAPAQQALYLQAPVAYAWDDHDYGGNDSDRSAPIRESVQSIYRSYVPHGPLASDEGIQQAFSVGRVRFILSDTRSYREPRADGSGTMLGREQLAWLEEELVDASRSHALVVWVSPSPWIGPADPGNDTWAGFPDERRRIADVIEGSGIQNLVMVSGDAHMVGLDDGTNSGFAGNGGGGFPVVHGGALDRPGSVKGGPYSHGTFPGAGRFGMLRIDDDGTRIDLEVSGRTWAGDVLLRYEHAVPVAVP